MIRMSLLLVAAALLAAPLPAQPFPWPGKTGPLGNGNVLPEYVGAMPLRWNEAENQHIAWKTPTKLAGHSTPVVGGGRIWFTSATEDGTRQYVDCLDAADGRVLHHKLIFENDSPEPLGNPVNNYAAPTPVIEPGGVYVHFGTYGTARLNPETADVVWQRRDINVRHLRGPGSSPVIFEDLLILTFDGADHQFLIALDKNTGETVWKTPRTTDYGDLGPDGKPLREGDLRKAYSTPALAEVDGRTQVISVGSRAAFGYDARTGEEIWKLRHDDYNAAAKPLIVGDLAIINTGSRGANLVAVRLDASTRGDITDTHVVWDRPRGNSRLSFPVLVGDAVAWISDTGVATAVDAKTGEECWSKRVGGNYVASPLVAGRRLYFFTTDGEGIVAEASDESLEILHRNELGEGMTASPSAAKDGLILRTGGHVYKIAR